MCRLQQLPAVRDATAVRQRIFYAHVCDMPTDSVDHFSRADATEALQLKRMTSSGYLMGVRLLFIGTMA